jgi:hypothetical protein
MKRRSRVPKLLQGSTRRWTPIYDYIWAINNYKALREKVAAPKKYGYLEVFIGLSHWQARSSSSRGHAACQVGDIFLDIAVIVCSGRIKTMMSWRSLRIPFCLKVACELLVMIRGEFWIPSRSMGAERDGVFLSVSAKFWHRLDGGLPFPPQCVAPMIARIAKEPRFSISFLNIITDSIYDMLHKPPWTTCYERNPTWTPWKPLGTIPAA